MKTEIAGALTREVLERAEARLKTPGTSTQDFGSTMRDALREVAAVQQNAAAVTSAFEAGEEADVTKVMLARQKASIAFEATLQLRNKLLSAYKDIMSMPV